MLRCNSPISPAFSATMLAMFAIAVAIGTPLAAATLSAEQVIAGWAQQSKHPLVGKIWLPRERRLIDGLALSQGVLIGSPVADAIGIKGKDFLLLGEIHDNPAHHLFRAGLIEAVTAPTAFGRTVFPAVVSEHIRADQAADLEAFRASDPPADASSADRLFEHLQWSRSGWPDAQIFRPLFAAIIEARLPLLPGNATRDGIRMVARTGFGSLGAEEMTRLGLDRPWPEPLAAALTEEIKVSHCGVLPDSAVPGMASAQRYRDAVLADAMIAGRERYGAAILIAGNGHVRSDRAVPWYLHQRAPGRTALTVVQTEVEDGSDTPERYEQRDPGGAPTADVIVFTPRAERKDPCEQMRAGAQRVK